MGRLLNWQPTAGRFTTHGAGAFTIIPQVASGRAIDTAAIIFYGAQHSPLLPVATHLGKLGFRAEDDRR